MDSNTSFNTSPLIGDGKQTLSLNDIEYSISMDDTNMDGWVGLGYDGIDSIIFFDFKAQSVDQLTADSRNNSIKTTDSLTILLGGKSLFLKIITSLYDSEPYEILSGHVAAKLPCRHTDSYSDVQIVSGNIPEFNPIELELIPELSIAGSLCLYQGEIPSNQNSSIYDFVIQNNSTDVIDSPETSSVIVSFADLSNSPDTGN